MIKRRIFAFCTALFILFFLVPFSVFGKEECSICKELSEVGFPPSYLEDLCALTMENDTWEFIPLFVTELSREKGENYDFEYVLTKEYQVRGRSLVSAKEVFAPYWEEGSDLFDRGFYMASRQGIGYFLDPRNFLCEKDIFQFLLLSGDGDVSSQKVAEVLENCAVAEVISSLPEKLVALGKEMNLNPLFLAARLRQEQGSEGNVLLYGKAGEVSGDSSLSGFYNIFNIGASGTGENQVYRTGGEYAKKMGWDTPEKALLGGIRILSEEYVTNHQDTLYLQKWNVDPRSVTKDGQSRNFWAQFMQNIGGAKTESDFLYEVLKDQGEGLKFLIPIYENMPENPCLDPADGACPVFAAGEKKGSPHRYESAPVIAEPLTTKVEEELKDENPTESFQMIRGFLFVLVPAAILLFWLKGKKGKNSGKSRLFGKK